MLNGNGVRKSVLNGNGVRKSGVNGNGEPATSMQIVFIMILSI